MSADNNEEADEEEMIRCASCGVSGDDVNLRKCTACYLVRYCGVKCQKEHRKKHKKECKKRAAELHDELLFKQPESTHFGDCPICMIPLPLDPLKSTLMPCCSEVICNGCDYSIKMREFEGRFQQGCPFCRNPTPESQIEADKIRMKRVEANDPVAFQQLATQRYQDERDYEGAFEYWTKAAELGDALSHYHLSWLYVHGEGVEKDKKKEVHHLEQAAIGGHPEARHSLGMFEGINRRYERAARHLIIAAKLGFDESMKNLKLMYKDGLVSKDVFASTLRAHKAAVDAMKSPQREAAETDVDYCEFRQNMMNECGF